MADLLYASQYYTTSLSVVGGINSSQTTDIVVQAISGVEEPTKPGVAVLSYSDPIDTSVAEWVTYTSVNTTTKTLVGVVRGAEGFSAKSHANGVTVAFSAVSQSHINRINDKLTGVDTGVILDDPTINGTPTFDTEAAAVVYRSTLTRQALNNGNFDIWQRGTSFTSATTPANSDDTYLIDRWNLISDGNDAVDITRDTDKPDGSAFSVKFDTETAKRYGIVQFIENKDSLKLDNKTVSLSFAAKTTSSQVTALRAAVLTWGSTADTVTSDVVGTWGATPTWAANWTQENTPADITITNSWATYKIEGIAIDTSTVNNIAVVIWTPNEETIGDVWYLSQVQLNEGTKALPFAPKSHNQELIDCQRFAYMMAQTDTFGTFGVGLCRSTTVARIHIPFPTEMRVAPSLVTSGTASHFEVFDGSSATDCSSVPVVASNSTSVHGSGVEFTVASGLTATRPAIANGNNTASGYLLFTADL